MTRLPRLPRRLARELGRDALGARGPPRTAPRRSPRRESRRCAAPRALARLRVRALRGPRCATAADRARSAPRFGLARGQAGAVLRRQPPGRLGEARLGRSTARLRRSARRRARRVELGLAHLAERVGGGPERARLVAAVDLGGAEHLGALRRCRARDRVAAPTAPRPRTPPPGARPPAVPARPRWPRRRERRRARRATGISGADRRG